MISEVDFNSWKPVRKQLNQLLHKLVTFFLSFLYDVYNRCLIVSVFNYRTNINVSGFGPKLNEKRKEHLPITYICLLFLYIKEKYV